MDFFFFLHRHHQTQPLVLSHLFNWRVLMIHWLRAWRTSSARGALQVMSRLAAVFYEWLISSTDSLFDPPLPCALLLLINTVLHLLPVHFLNERVGTRTDDLPAFTGEREQRKQDEPAPQISGCQSFFWLVTLFWHHIFLTASDKKNF